MNIIVAVYSHTHGCIIHMKSFSFEEEKSGRIYALPIQRLREECAQNLVFKGALEETLDACKTYARTLCLAAEEEDVSKVLESDQLERKVNLLYRDHPELENTIAEKISNLLRLLSMKNIDEVSILRGLKTNTDYAKCALETMHQLQTEQEEQETRHTKQKAA